MFFFNHEIVFSIDKVEEEFDTNTYILYCIFST